MTTRTLPLRPAPVAAILALLLLAVPATAQSGHFDDPAGDAPSALDLLKVAWDLQQATATVALHLAADPDPAASYTAILFIGEEGATQPAEWYIIHMGPGGDRVLAGHSTPVVETPAAVQRSNATLSVQFDRIAPAQAPCAFVVAQSWTGGSGSRNVADSAPDTATALAGAWQAGHLCNAMRHDDAVQESPPVGVFPLLAAFLAAFLLVRWRARVQ
jgi:hypothetical protein